jgi:nicotinamide mononucleotide transporter
MHSIWPAILDQWNSTSWLEIVADLTGLASVWLVVRGNIWTWPWGIVSVILFWWVFQSQRLFANAGLQIFCFLPLSVYGWWAWQKLGPTHNNDLPIATISLQGRAGWALATVGFSILMSLWMSAIHDASPILDGTTTAISIVAQYLQARKWFENWILWILADVIYLYLFPSQHLYITSALYFLFLILATRGAFEWSKIMRTQLTAVSPQCAGLVEDIAK